MSRLRASFLTPCLGVGGGDGFMLSLIRHARNIAWLGVAVENPPTSQQLADAIYRSGKRVTFHLTGKRKCDSQPVMCHENVAEAIRNAAHGADILISWHGKSLASVRRQLDLPVVQLTQNEDNYARDVGHLMCPQANYHAAVSHAAARAAFPSEYLDQVRIIYNGIEADRVTPRFGREAQRATWNIAEDELVVLFLGRLSPEKNPDSLLDALTDLPPNLSVLYAGDGPLRNQLGDRAARIAPGRVRFLPAQYHVGDVLSVSDVFALPSDVEGMPLAMQESMLAGVPVVASQFGAMAELSERFGALAATVPIRPTGAELAEAIRYATSPEFAPCRERAGAVAWQHFTISTVAAQWEWFLEEAVADWRRHRMQAAAITVAAAQRSTQAPPRVIRLRQSG